jgi:hypothetical protein
VNDQKLIDYKENNTSASLNKFFDLDGIINWKQPLFNTSIVRTVSSMSSKSTLMIPTANTTHRISSKQLNLSWTQDMVKDFALVTLWSIPKDMGRKTVITAKIC